jgi:septum formation protein
MIPIILASASASRAMILEQAGVEFTVSPSGVDEDEIKSAMLAAGRGPAEVAMRLATAKAHAVSAGRPDLVIGADQTLELEGELFDKTQTMSQTRDRLVLLRGRTHRLHSAACLARGSETLWCVTETSTLSMREFSDAYLDRYLADHGESLMNSVGAYYLEGRGVQLFDEIDGDFFAILGLPLLGLLGALRDAGGLPS